MATTNDFKDYIQDQLMNLKFVQFKKMFGEYGLFYMEKMVGVLADNKLYIKPTEEGKAFLGEVMTEKFYKEGKPYFLIEDTDNRDQIEQLIVLTYESLPAKVQKKKARL